MTKIVLAQIDSIAGDIKTNSKIIEENIIEAKKHNAEIVIFPAYALCGYPFGDMYLRHKSLLDKQIEELNNLADLADGIIVIVGYLKKDNNSGVAILQNKQILYSDILSYNSEIFQIVSGKYDILKANDIKTSVTGIIHCGVSTTLAYNEFEINSCLSEIANNNKIKYLYVNKVGYADNLCFDGCSRVYNEDGKLCARAEYLSEDILVVDNFKGLIKDIPQGMDEKESETFSLNYCNDLERLYKELVFGIKEYFSKSGFDKAVLGLSGGLDSSVCAVLLADALDEKNVYAISMPTKISSKGSKDDAENLAKNLGINYIVHSISKETEVMLDELSNIYSQIHFDKYGKTTTNENIQARTRATILWGISNEYKGMLPIATSDKSEAYIGYATINGDMSGGFAPIADVTKTKLFALADYMNKNRKIKNAIPKSILEKPPGAELKLNPITGQLVTAEEDNMPYPFLDEIIWLIENKNYGIDAIKKHKFVYEKENYVSLETKLDWINKFYKKSQCAVFKWHILPPSIITNKNTINQSSYYQPIISKLVWCFWVICWELYFLL